MASTRRLNWRKETILSSGKLTQRLVVMDWLPTKLNDLLQAHWRRRLNLKRFDADIVKCAAISKGITPATTKRRVSCVFCSRHKSGRLPDPDAFFKSLHDAMVSARLLVDDSDKWLEIGTPRVIRGRRDVTVITLEDL